MGISIPPDQLDHYVFIANVSFLILGLVALAVWIWWKVRRKRGGG
jgi:membrane protein DedA with SNARE-associated domain